jgi:hypothetical protein
MKENEISHFYNVLGHHPDNPHKLFYNLTSKGGNSINLVRCGQNGQYYNFVNIAEITFNQKASYQIKIKNCSTTNNILIGFCTK